MLKKQKGAIIGAAAQKDDTAMASQLAQTHFLEALAEQVSHQH